jgi:thiol:disulfide interchange protein
VQEDEFIGFLEGSLSDADVPASGFAGRGAVITVLLILLGGLALNLTPCVLPMIPINLAIIGAGVGSGSKSRGFMLGGAYGAGIALVYGVLGLVVLLTNSTFGTLNSSPWFNMGVAAVFAVLSLSMFGAFNIDFSRLQGKIKTGDGSRGKVLVSFFLGGVAALLAGACVAPVVISVLLLAADLYQKGNPAGLLLPFILGLGMALPWPFAGAGISFLPKPGAWMEKIKYTFGVIILLGAGYYGLLGATLLQDRSKNRRFEGDSAQEERIKEGWHTDLASGLAISRMSGQPVFIDFWASWCKNCLKMEKTTFKAEAVKVKLDGFVKVKYRAENPRDPATKAVLDSFDIVGLPTYVVLVPEAAEE